MSVVAAMQTVHAQGDNLDPQFAAVVAAYQPAWMPPKGELTGVVVLIDPAGGGATTIDARRQDDLCLWTGAHLFHLVRSAGGTHLLNRPDDRPVVAQVNSPKPPDVIVHIEADAAASDVQITMDAAEPPVWTVRVPTAHAQTVNGVPAHRLWAETIYRTLARHANELRHDRSPGSQPASVPFYPLQEPESAFTRAGSVIWPEGTLPASKAPWFCEMFIQRAFSDRTNVYFNPVVTVTGENVLIEGELTHPSLAQTLEKALNRVGVKNVQTHMRLLPEQGHLPPDQWFGLCIAPMALNYAKPFEGAPVQTQLLYGEPVFLLDRVNGFYLLHGGDGYWAWVRENCIRIINREEFTAWLTSPQVLLLEDVLHDNRRIVRGSHLPLARGSDTTGASVTAMLPEGGVLSLAPEQARVFDTRDIGPARVKAALALLETPYVFAGRSSVGLDCSGLVGTVCDQFGTVLPRDAAQQFVTGRLVATRWYMDALRPGDRIYFLNDLGKISHTGMWIGDQHFVHSSPPGVQISSLRPGDRLFREHWEQHFLGARRP